MGRGFYCKARAVLDLRTPLLLKHDDSAERTCQRWRCRRLPRKGSLTVLRATSPSSFLQSPSQLPAISRTEAGTYHPGGAVADALQHLEVSRKAQIASPHVEVERECIGELPRQLDECAQGAG